MAFDYSQVSAVYITANGAATLVLDDYTDADATAVATAAGLADAANPAAIVVADNQEFFDLLATAEEMTYFDVSGLPSGFQADITLALRQANLYGDMVLKDAAANVVLSDKKGPSYVIASEAEFILLMAFVYPDGDFSVVEFGSLDIADDTRAAINGLSNEDTATILTMAGVADTTGNRYSVASQAECDAIVAQYFSLIKKKK